MLSEVSVVFPPTGQAGCVLVCVLVCAGVCCGDGHSVGPPPALLQVTGSAVQPVQASKKPFFCGKREPDQRLCCVL